MARITTSRALLCAVLVTLFASFNVIKTMPELRLQEQDIMVSTVTELRSQEQDMVSKVTTTISKNAKWAYAFLIAGVNTDHPSHRFYLYDVAISAYILLLNKSQADVVVLIQMHPGSEGGELPPEDLNLLQALPNIKIRYIPPPGRHVTFFQQIMTKFEVVKLTQYDRVLFLDSDVTPFCNLDYLFSLSERGRLKENLLLAGPGEPSNGGFWMISPQEGDYEHLQQIIVETALRTIKGGEFNKTTGWGHVMGLHTHDVARFIGTGKKYTKSWDFYCANADQGLLYQWLKYEKKNVSIIVGDEVEQWGSNSEEDGELQFQGIDRRILNQHSCLPSNATDPGHYAHPFYHLFDASKLVPYRDFGHFWAKKKPWNVETTQELLMKLKDAPVSPYDADSPAQFWWSMLRELHWKHNLTLSLEDIPLTKQKGTDDNLKADGSKDFIVEQMKQYLDWINTTNPKTS